MNVQEIKSKYLGDSLASEEANKLFHENKKDKRLKEKIKEYAWTKEANNSLKEVQIGIDGNFEPYIGIGTFGRAMSTSHMSVPVALKLSQELAKAARYIQTNKR